MTILDIQFDDVHFFNDVKTAKKLFGKYETEAEQMRSFINS